MSVPVTPRRRFVIMSGALVAGGLLASHGAQAQTNPALRSALKYQDKPSGANKCDNCMHWIPGPNPKAKGGCKVIPGDTQISPEGWCSAWAAVPGGAKK
jgi:hypothetical protein